MYQQSMPMPSSNDQHMIQAAAMQQKIATQAVQGYANYQTEPQCKPVKIEVAQQ